MGAAGVGRSAALQRIALLDRRSQQRRAALAAGMSAAAASPAAHQMYCAGHRQVVFLLKYGLKEAAFTEGQAVQETPSVPTCGTNASSEQAEHTPFHNA